MGGQDLQKTDVFGASVSCLYDVQECEFLTEGRWYVQPRGGGRGGEKEEMGTGRYVNKVEIVGETTLAVRLMGSKSCQANRQSFYQNPGSNDNCSEEKADEERGDESFM